MKMPPLLADFTHARPCKPFCEKYLTLPVAEIAQLEGTDRRRVWDSIRRGLKKLARLLDAAR